MALTNAHLEAIQHAILAGYDRDAAAVAKLATADGLHLVHQAAVNEELAATAVMGSQLSVTLDSCRYDGIIGIWYGKSPGLDRASDAAGHNGFVRQVTRSGAEPLAAPR